MSPRATTDRWAEVERRFAQGLSLSAGARSVWLGQLARDDPAVFAEVASLLSAHDRSGPLDRAPQDLLDEALHHASRTPLESPGATIGPFRVVRLLGRGGMGTVVLGEREEGGFRQRVAIKLMRPGLEDDDARLRFLRERRILAGLEHPGIARFVDAGFTESGVPYLAMEFVSGLPVHEFCDRGGLGIEERLELFVRICDVVEYAHGRLVVHRDLKPANVVVTDEGRVKLLDFGIAKLLAPDAGELTRTGGWATPEYASPEQLLGEPVTTASDTYSLGVILYELLTGHRPIPLDELPAHRVAEVILSTDPERPSAAVLRPQGRGTATSHEIARARGLRPDRLRRKLMGDLDTILLKALHRDLSRRYRSVSELSADVRRHLAGRPVLARPDSWPYTAGRFVRRHRIAVGAAVAVGVSLLGGFGGTVWQARRAQAEAERAAEERDQARQVSALLVDVFKLSDPGAGVGEAITARELLDRGATKVRADLSDRPLLQAQMLFEIGSVYENLGLFDRADESLTTVVDLRADHLGDAEPVHQARAALGRVRFRRGELDSGQRLLEEAVIGFERLGTTPDSSVVDALYHLGDAYRFRQRPDEARAVYERAVEVAVRSLGPRHPMVAHAHFGLATTLLHGGRSTDASDQYRRALDIYRSLPGRAHPQAVRALHNLALVAQFRGRTHEAEPLLLEAEEMARSLFAPDHIMLVSVQGSLGSLYLSVGRFAEAEAILAPLVPVVERIEGADHTSMADLLGTYGWALRALERFDEGLAALTRAAEILEDAFEPDHPRVWMARLNVTRAFAEVGSDLEASAGFARARADLPDPAGPGLAYAIQLDVHEGDFLRDRGRVEEAERRYRAALSAAEGALRPGHRFTAGGMIGLAELWIRTGRGAEADSILREVNRARTPELDDGHVELARIRLAEAEAALLAGRLAEAGARAREALRIRESSYPAGHGRLAEVATTLAAIALALGDTVEALEWLEPAERVLRGRSGSLRPVAERAGDVTARLALPGRNRGSAQDQGPHERRDGQAGVVPERIPQQSDRDTG